MADPIFFDPTQQAPEPTLTRQQQLAALLMQKSPQAPQMITPSPGAGWAGTLANGIAAGMGNYNRAAAAESARIQRGLDTGWN